MRFQRRPPEVVDELGQVAVGVAVDGIAAVEDGTTATKDGATTKETSSNLSPHLQ